MEGPERRERLGEGTSGRVMGEEGREPLDDDDGRKPLTKAMATCGRAGGKVCRP